MTSLPAVSALGSQSNPFWVGCIVAKDVHQSAVRNNGAPANHSPACHILLTDNANSTGSLAPARR